MSDADDARRYRWLKLRWPYELAEIAQKAFNGPPTFDEIVDSYMEAERSRLADTTEASRHARD